MKKLTLIFMICLVARIGCCQVAAIAVDKENLLYECVENPITIAVENTSRNAIIVSTDNGIIRGNEDHNGHYIILNARKGYSVVTIKKKTKNGLITVGICKFRVHGIPCTVFLNNETGGEISKISICSQIALWVPIENFQIDASFPVLGFTIIVHRNNEVIFKRETSSTSSGRRFDSTTNDFFTTLRNDDSVFFTEVTIRDCDRTIRKIDQSLSFKIVESEKYHKPVHIPGEEYEEIDPVTGEIIKKRY